MGFESFRVELRGGAARPLDADETIRGLPHAKPDLGSVPLRGSAFYVFDDGKHIVEVERKDFPVKLSCRFTLCHPPSVDAYFLDIVRELMLRLGMEVTICDDVRPEHAQWYPLARFAEFSSIVRAYIAARRAEWIAAIGPAHLAATTSEVCRQIILPQCEPVTEPPRVNGGSGGAATSR